jgi:hypothetical protein
VDTRAEADGDDAKRGRGAVLDPVDRISEVLFGLLMSMGITGAFSVASVGRDDVQAMTSAALGCNLAWGLVDAVMYLVRANVERGRRLALLRSIRGAQDDPSAEARIAAALPDGWARALPPGAIGLLRERVRALPDPPARAGLSVRDFAAAAGVFALVVLATFPIVVPFLAIDDPRTALRTSNAVGVAMLFAAGWSLGRHADVGPARMGVRMVVVGLALVGAIVALGG